MSAIDEPLIPGLSSADINANSPYLAADEGESELETALIETRADLAAGRFVRESPAAHLARLDAMKD
jgi:hypothetical protein